MCQCVYSGAKNLLLQCLDAVSIVFKITGSVQLTLYIELDGRIGHPHHVLCDAGQLEVVVISADVEKSEVDRVDVGPIYV